MNELRTPIELAMLREKDEAVHAALATLSYREREIIKLRYGLDDGHTYTLEEIGRIFRVTRERVRQIESKAIRKLQHPDRMRMMSAAAELPPNEYGPHWRSAVIEQDNRVSSWDRRVLGRRRLEEAGHLPRPIDEIDVPDKPVPRGALLTQATIAAIQRGMDAGIRLIDIANIFRVEYHRVLYAIRKEPDDTETARPTA